MLHNVKNLLKSLLLYIVIIAALMGCHTMAQRNRMYQEDQGTGSVASGSNSDGLFVPTFDNTRYYSDGELLCSFAARVLTKCIDMQTKAAGLDRQWFPFHRSGKDEKRGGKLTSFHHACLRRMKNCYDAQQKLHALYNKNKDCSGKEFISAIKEFESAERKAFSVAQKSFNYILDSFDGFWYYCSRLYDYKLTSVKQLEGMKDIFKVVFGVPLNFDEADEEAFNSLGQPLRGGYMFTKAFIEACKQAQKAEKAFIEGETQKSNHKYIDEYFGRFDMFWAIIDRSQYPVLSYLDKRCYPRDSAKRMQALLMGSTIKHSNDNEGFEDLYKRAQIVWRKAFDKALPELLSEGWKVLLNKQVERNSKKKCGNRSLLHPKDDEYALLNNCA